MAHTRFPSAKRIGATLSISPMDALLVRGLMDGSVNPLSIEATREYASKCFREPTRRALALHAIDTVLGNHGVEYLADASGRAVFEYSNTGESYAATVGYHADRGWLVCGWADVAERERLP